MTDLTERCARAGIATRYTDNDGQVRRTSRQALEALIERLGERREGGPAAFIVPADKPWRQPVDAARARLKLEDGSAGDATVENGILHLAALPFGYHTLDLDGEAYTVLAVPARCYMPAPWPRGRAWGLQAQLYGLRGADDGGIGTLGDLASLGRIASEAGASFIGVNPLHALFPREPDRRSPYSPSSRLYLNPIYLTVEGVEAPSADLVDYDTVWTAKRAALRASFERFEDDGTFAAWREAEGRPLRDHCVFEALDAHFDAPWWGDWPEDYRDPRSKAVDAFANEQAREVTWHAWLQWHCAVELEDAAEAAPGFGLYRDLAVGANQGGSEFWANQTLFAAGVDVGAPPDGFSPNGQNWGLPPLRPAALDGAEGLAHFRALIGANMRGSGLLRIDHAFQLERLYVVPHGFDNSDGAYVDYPLELLLAVLKIESHRHECVVVAEDLGTAPDGFRERITDAGLLTYKVFYFERDGAEFAEPDTFDRTAFASISTHDLPTLAGWWAGRDIEWRETVGDVGAEASAEMREGREHDRAVLARQLGVPNTDATPIDAIIDRMGRSNAMLVGVQLEDVAGEVEQANLPGTMDEHPNWKRRLSLDLAALAPRLNDLGSRMSALGRDGEARFPLSSTYRFQFHAGFTFADAEAQIPYLASLGISHVYASPVFEAEPGSMHGYDGTDPTVVSEALGGEAGLRAFVEALRAKGMGLLIDIVPNHLGIASGANAWWQSVLTWGAASPYASVFDIDWPRHGPDRGTVALPVLGRSYGEAVLAGELEMVLQDDGTLALAYYDARFPIDPRSAARLLRGDPALSVALPKVEADDAELRAALLDNAEAVRAELARINATHTLGRDSLLHDAIRQQNYRLLHWRSGTDALTHRRFFDINTLAGLRVEDEAVFETVHRGVFRLHEAGLTDGVRIDHVDGLARPTEYLHRLRRRLGADAVIYVEKILEHGEALPAEWPVDGTSGYDALNVIDGVFVKQSAQSVFDGLVGPIVPFAERLRAAKLHMIGVSFRGELAKLAKSLHRRLRADFTTQDITRTQIELALRELLAAMPVYRTYFEEPPSTARDEAILRTAIIAAKPHAKGLAHVFDALETALLDHEAPAWSEAVRRFQQLSGPVMAKGLEDTLFYRDARLISLNEVGGAPETFGHGPNHVHTFAVAQARDWPGAMVATATHDTKRGEDARARITALTHHAEDWVKAVAELEDLTAGGQLDAAHRLTFYQAALGARHGTDIGDRLSAYALKALREGKQRTTWTEPDEAYEVAANAFVRELVRPGSNADKVLARVHRTVEGTANAITLNRTILKHTLPGVPDTYQGTETTETSLVDPDNRRPVDYTALSEALEAEGSDEKVALTQRLLHLAKALHPLFAIGSYTTLPFEPGLGFSRHHDMWTCKVELATRFDSPVFGEEDGVVVGPFARVTLNEAAQRVWDAYDKPWRAAP